MKSNL